MRWHRANEVQKPQPENTDMSQDSTHQEPESESEADERLTSRDLLAVYRGLWCRIPERERQRMENIMLQWAPGNLTDAYRKEMQDRESSPDWKPSLGDFNRNFCG